MRPPTKELRRLLFLGLVAGSATAAFTDLSSSQESVPGRPAAVTDAGPESAIDPARLAAGMQVYKDAGCRACHGWAADGEAEDPNPRGPSLRESTLDEDGLRMTVACGRPSTPMPYYYRSAYRPIGEPQCYGSTLVQLGPAAPAQGRVRLDDEQLDTLTYYLANYVSGLGEITYEQCEYFFGPAQRCERYPRANGEAAN